MWCIWLAALISLLAGFLLHIFYVGLHREMLLQKDFKVVFGDLYLVLNE
jgi:hypothetical protein